MKFTFSFLKVQSKKVLNTKYWKALRRIKHKILQGTQKYQTHNVTKYSEQWEVSRFTPCYAGKVTEVIKCTMRRYYFWGSHMCWFVTSGVAQHRQSWPLMDEMLRGSLWWSHHTHTAWARVSNAHFANVLPVMWTLAIFEKVTLTIFVQRLAWTHIVWES